MKRNYLILSFVAFLAACLLSPNMAAAGKTLKLGALVSNKSLAYKSIVKFADHIKKSTGGDYTVRTFPGQQLGPGKEMMQMLKMSTLDLYHGTNAQPSYFKEGKNFNITAAPYCFRNQQEFIKFIETPIFKEMVQQLSRGGLKLIGYMGSRSPRALTTTNTPVRKPSDMKGLKLRVPGMPSLFTFFKLCGASPTPMPFTEFFMAAKTGVVEGQDNGIEVVYPRGLYEVQKYYMKTDHSLGAWMLYASEKKWGNWPEKLRKAILEGCKIAAKHNNAELDAYMADAFNKVQEKGMVVIEVDKEHFVKIAHKVWSELDGTEWDKGFMDKVQKQLEDFRK